MKRFLNYYLSMVLIASLFVVTSCDPEEETPIIDAPAITFDGVTGDELTVGVGEDVDFIVNVAAPGGFNRMVISATVGAAGTPVELLDTARVSGVDAPTTFTFPFSFTPTADLAGEDVFFEFFVVGEDLQETTREFIVRVAEPQVVTFNTVLLQAPTEDQTNQLWFSTSTGERYSTVEVDNADASLFIDFGYRYGPTNKATLASPAAFPSAGGQDLSGWATLNETLLRRVSSGVSETAFIEMGNDSDALLAAFFEGTEVTESPNSPQRLTNLQVGDVLAFRTDPDKLLGSRYGIIRVEEINLGADGTGFGSDAFISLDVKVQAPE